MNLTIHIPTNWNACSDLQLNKLALLINSGLAGFKFDYKCLRILIDAKWWQFKTKAKLILLFNNVPISELKQDFDFIFKSNTLTRFPELKNGYYPPMSEITNLTMAEMAIADDLHIKWRNTRNQEYLYYLAACLYVNQKQPRPAFDKNDIPGKLDGFRKVPIEQLLVIEMAFHGCKEYLASKFKDAFPKPKGGKVSNARAAQGSGFPALILQLSGGKFGNHEQTSRTNCYVFLAEFENLLKQKPNGK